MKLYLFLVLLLPSGLTKGLENQINEHLICGTWQLVKTTNLFDKTVYLHNGSSTFTLNCELRIWQAFEKNEFVRAGIWRYDTHESQLQISVDGILNLVPVLWVDDETMILHFGDEHLEYKRLGY